MVRLLIGLVAFLLISSSWAVDAVASENVQVMVTRTHQDGHAAFDIEVEAFASASTQRAWEVLTDYERLPEFVPNLLSSTLISRDSDSIVLDQRSRAGFFFIKQDIHLILRITEHPHTAIDVALVSGDMRQYNGRWEIGPARMNGNDGVHLRYTGHMEPDFFVPPMFGSTMVERDVKRMVEAVVTEIGATARNE